jgi:hypothetical protein
LPASCRAEVKGRLMQVPGPSDALRY